jgi:Cytochrome c3
MAQRKTIIWTCWTVAVIALAAYFTWTLLGRDRTLFLIGRTTDGHHQIELACETCHTSPFGGGQVLQDACVKCHGEDLARENDSHPRTKFTDPRNADRVAVLDARVCITCHREHKPGITGAMGLTLPDDYCFKCHQTIAKDRPSHKGLAFNTCASAGCHNFHDNRALYEDFLSAHLHDIPLKTTPQVALLTKASADAAWVARALKALDRSSVPPEIASRATDPKIVHEWETTAHAKAGVACADCHIQKAKGQTAAVWIDKPGHKACESCHATETVGFLAGRHGMRLADGLSVPMTPMTPAMARVPMRADAHGKELGCATCHGVHRFDIRYAAVEACTGCHNDAHTRNFPQSAHAAAWEAELAGLKPAGTGVSCATCHLPREIHRGENGDLVRAQHNQNQNLRPNEKMIRSVCLTCHGLGFSIDALADPEVVRSNFAKSPSRHVESLDWVARRQKASDPSRPPAR